MGGKARETARLKVQEGVHEAPVGCLATGLPPRRPLGAEIVERGLVQSRALS